MADRVGSLICAVIVAGALVWMAVYLWAPVVTLALVKWWRMP